MPAQLRGPTDTVAHGITDPDRYGDSDEDSATADPSADTHASDGAADVCADLDSDNCTASDLPAAVAGHTRVFWSFQYSSRRFFLLSFPDSVRGS